MRDRSGHTANLLGFAAVVALLACPAAAIAQSQVYRAQRFDVDVRVLPGGKMQVDETIVFDFQQGTFTRVWRDISTAKTDGIQVLEATLDGEPQSRGTGAGQVTVTARTNVHVEWHFAPTGPSVHTFGLTYDVAGVGRTDGGRDLIEWQALPSRHSYPIDSSRVVFRTPRAPADAPSFQTRRVDDSSIIVENGLITASATGIAADGWISVGLRFPERSLVHAQPGWLTRREAQWEAAPRWILTAACVFAGGLVVLMLARAGYRSPVAGPPSTETAPPGRLEPAIAATLLARGETRMANPIATLLSLADRGVIAVQEGSRSFGVRSFTLTQVPGSHELTPHEETALRLAFADGGDDVSLSRASGRLARHRRQFSSILTKEMIERGLIDADRKTIRMRMTIAGAVLMAAGGVGMLALVPLVSAYGAWPLLIGPALGLAGIIGLIMAAGTSALTDEGSRDAARWSGFRRHLKAIATSRTIDDAGAPVEWATYAAAFGLGYYWARYLKRRGGPVPTWFAAADGGSASVAYAALIGIAGAPGHAAGGGASGSGAAGGGASGAA